MFRQVHVAGLLRNWVSVVLAAGVISDPSVLDHFYCLQGLFDRGGGGGVTRSAMQWNSLGKNTVPGSLPGSARAQVFQQVAQRPRTFKYGTCDKHGLALKPCAFLA